MEYGKGLLKFDERHLLNLALKEMQMDLTKKLVYCNNGMSKQLIR